MNTKSIASLFAVSSSTSSKLNNSYDARKAPQTAASLERTFPGITNYMESVINAKFVSAEIVDGDRYLDIAGETTDNDELGEATNPMYMKVVASNRTAWLGLKLINEELYQITNGIWNSREKNGSLMLLGFNDGSEGSVYGYKKFTVTEAGALATLMFGTKEDRSTGLFFKNYIVQSIQAQHDYHVETEGYRKFERIEEGKSFEVTESEIEALINNLEL